MTSARRPPIPAIARSVLDGDRRALARLITRVENRDPESVPIVRALYSSAGKARVVGITGPLGVGKSSLVNALLQHLRASGRSVGVVAVDPSSPFSGGSVLGDRIRLDRKADDDGVFIRSMASRGHSGGVAAATREVVRILDAAGFDVILVETVGSGQVDVEIRDVATTSVVVVVPHLGDEVQTLKAGLFEIADVFCVNKGDLVGADTAARDLMELTGLGQGRDGWRPKVVTTSTKELRGIESLWAAIEGHETFLDQDGRRAAAERVRLSHELADLVREQLDRELSDRLEADPDVTGLLDRLVARTTDPHAAADRLHESLRSRASG